MVFVTAVPPPLGVNVTVIVKRLRLEAFRAARPCARTTTVVKVPVKENFPAVTVRLQDGLPRFFFRYRLPPWDRRRS